MPRRLLALLCAVGATAVLAGSAEAALHWPPPALTAPTTISVTESRNVLKLDPAKDYVLELPADRPLRATGGLTVDGGRNVVLVGGEISIPYQGPTPDSNDRRALYLRGQTGTVHVEGLLLSGPDLNEGIDLDQRRGATVQIQNVRVERAAPRDAADRAAFHTDVIQTWAGPAMLRVDRLTASTGYQGFFFQPSQFGTMPTQPWELSNINLVGLPGAAYLLWKAAALQVRTSNLWLQPAPGRSLTYSVWGPLTAWGSPLVGTPSDFVPAGTAGRLYASDAAPAAAPAPVAPVTAAPAAPAAGAPAAAAGAKRKPAAKRKTKRVRRSRACSKAARKRSARRARRASRSGRRRAARCR